MGQQPTVRLSPETHRTLHQHNRDGETLGETVGRALNALGDRQHVRLEVNGVQTATTVVPVR